MTDQTKKPRLKNSTEYWKHVGSFLDQWTAQNRQADVQDVVGRGFALYSFVLEYLKEDATQNQALVDPLSSLLVLTQDVLRGLVTSCAFLVPASIATQLRMTFEARCNLRFITTRSDPAFWASRYERYGIHIERILREEYRPNKEETWLSPQEDERIRKLCPEWFASTKSQRDRRVRPKHWTADENFKTLSAMAKEVGLQEDYFTLYNWGSMFMHGSATLRNFYSDHQGLHVLAKPISGCLMALMAVRTGIDTIEEMANFFGAPIDQGELNLFGNLHLEAAERLNAIREPPRRQPSPEDRGP